MSYFSDNTYYTKYELTRETNKYKKSLKWHLWLYIGANGSRCSEWFTSEHEAIKYINTLKFINN